VDQKRRRVVRTLNRPRLVAGIEVRLFGAVFLIALLLFATVSRMGALLLITALLLLGKKMSKTDVQMPLLWLHSLHQGSSYDPAKRGRERAWDQARRRR
jgi:type IV secretory pathway VirB3-like protein